MLNLKILGKKKDFTKMSGDTVLDLIARVVSFLGVRVQAGTRYVVTDDTQMRADLIANQFYGDTGYCDALLKYNGYSNPFSLATGDILAVPPADVMNQYLSGAGKGVGTTRKKQSNVIFTPKSKRDKNRVDFLIKKTNSVAPVPPNVALDNGVKLANGKIVFGADVTNIKKSDCPEPISRTKLKESLIKNKLAK